MKKLRLHFDITGGYDCMYGAWVIDEVWEGDSRTLIRVDLRDFGQQSCHYEYQSPEAEALARNVYAHLLIDYRMEGVV